MTINFAKGAIIQVAVNYSDTPFGRLALTVRLTWHYILALVALAALFYRVFPPMAVLPGLAICFVLFFFRNPKREIPAGSGTFLSPADGVVLEVDEVFEDKFLLKKTKRVRIFLSLLNVHFNRSPIDGEVVYRFYCPGRHLAANVKGACELNEKNYIGIEGQEIKVLVCQIAGLLARRIKCWVAEGEKVKKGEIIGIIKFGSGTEVYLPADAHLLVKKGDRVKAGTTVLATFSPADKKEMANV